VKEEMHIMFWSENLQKTDQLGRLMHGWDDNIKMDCKEIGYEGVEWIQPSQNEE
jgi:hypothetical protein